ncbi:DUF6603 domain-containing protein [Streptomyces leeuwenhoekii]|uniref:DUF6603 domain-containing protein n=1 Tax=Streptomyces leeuwenhoekii TaxID=1437453 RepID=UPI0036F791BE
MNDTRIPEPFNITVTAVTLRLERAAGSTATTVTVTAKSSHGDVALVTLPGKPSSTRLALVGVRTDAGLTDLPVLGSRIPPDADVRLCGARLTMASRKLVPTDAQRLNSLLAKAKADGMLRVPTAGMPGATRFAAVVSVGKRRLALEAPVGKRKAQAPFVAASDGTVTLPHTPQAGLVAEPAAPQDGAVAWYRLDRSFGPVRVERLGVRYAGQVMWLLADASVSLAGLTLAGRGLGVGVPLTDKRQVRPTIEGMGVGWSRPPVEVAGALLYRSDETYELLLTGMAALSTPSLCLQAVGGYAKRRHQQPSLFVFGRLALESGQGIGPPFLRVTGAAAGFGYNSAVRHPTLAEVPEFPLMPARRTAAKDPLRMLDALAGGSNPWIREAPGRIWLAAGLDADSFSYVHASLLLLAQVDIGGDTPGFSALLAGRAALDFPRTRGTTWRYAHVALAVQAAYESHRDAVEVFAAVEPGSFLVHPSCHLSGQAAACVWLGRSPHRGQFVVSLGGYHPDFQPPAHYPRPARLALTWSAGQHVSARGTCYGALVPSAFMAGTSLDISFDTTVIHAWCRAGLDAMVQWDPFFYRVRSKVDVGVEIQVWPYPGGSVGVDMDLWGPPTGGCSTVHFRVWSFTIRFGEKAPAAPKLLSWQEFTSRYLPEPVVQIVPLSGLAPAGAPPENGFPAPQGWLVTREGFNFTVRTSVPVVSVRLGQSTRSPKSKDLADRTKPVCVRPVGAGDVKESLCRITLSRDGTIIDPEKENWTVSGAPAPVPPAWWGKPLPGPGSRAPRPQDDDDVQAVTAVRFAAPTGQGTGAALPMHRQRLGHEQITGPPVPVQQNDPADKPPVRTGQVRDLLAQDFAEDRVTAARSELARALTEFAVIPAPDGRLWDELVGHDPLFEEHLSAYLRTDPLLADETGGVIPS